MDSAIMDGFSVHFPGFHPLGPTISVVELICTDCNGITHALMTDGDHPTSSSRVNNRRGKRTDGKASARTPAQASRHLALTTTAVTGATTAASSATHPSLQMQEQKARRRQRPTHPRRRRAAVRRPMAVVGQSLHASTVSPAATSSSNVDVPKRGHKENCTRQAQSSVSAISAIEESSDEGNMVPSKAAKTVSKFEEDFLETSFSEGSKDEQSGAAAAWVEELRTGACVPPLKMDRLALSISVYDDEEENVDVGPSAANRHLATTKEVGEEDDDEYFSETSCEESTRPPTWSFFSDSDEYFSETSCEESTRPPTWSFFSDDSE